MKIYIASSFKNQLAVELLTEKLRQIEGVRVFSFIEHNRLVRGDHPAPEPFEEWVQTPAADNVFCFDTTSATTSDLVIYVGPSGCDAWAEIGAAWASKVPVLGLWAKGEASGLMRLMITEWFSRWPELVAAVNTLSLNKRTERNRHGEETK